MYFKNTMFYCFFTALKLLLKDLPLQPYCIKTVIERPDPVTRCIKTVIERPDPVTWGERLLMKINEGIAMQTQQIYCTRSKDHRKDDVLDFLFQLLISNGIQ